ncbi:MAG: VCBS repeat-containing protein, partial [Verrucomicrobiota bacterium]
MPHFCDYDQDGDLDVFVTGYQFRDPAGRPARDRLPVVKKGDDYSIKPGFEKYYGFVQGVTGQRLFRNVGRADFLLQSNAAQRGDQPIRFTDVTAKAGISGLGVGNSAVWWDYDGDGFPDLFIANDFKAPDQLYLNNGDGTFTDVIKNTLPHTTWFSMGSDAGDLNNDGRFDLLVSDMAGTTHYRSKVTMGEMADNATFLKRADPQQYMRNAVFINTGTRRFLEAAHLTGLDSSDWTWAAKTVDLDNDGKLDVFFTNGAARMFNHSDFQHDEAAKVGQTEWDLWENSGPRLEENLAFRNQGHLQFENVSEAWGLSDLSMSYSCVHGDIDNDGDLDLVIANLDKPLSVYENRCGGNRIKVSLKGRSPNTQGLGAVVSLDTASGKQIRQMMPMTGFLSSNDPAIHFGLGNETTIQSLRIDWPGGRASQYRNLKAGHHYHFPEEEARPAPPKKPDPYPQFAISRVVPAIRHQEIEYDDFLRQPLLPYKHSQLGPGMAVGDVDGDGDVDFYLGRAKGTRRAVYLNNGRGALAVKAEAPFEKDTIYEDLGCLFFDADRDSDLDLYVVSGSVEGEAGAGTMADRLYLNDGSGSFSKGPSQALPDLRTSGSTVTAADFDRDGDLDLFVGGRIVPGAYPTIPRSTLLENRSQPGRPSFTDSTDKLASGLAEAGLVTSGLWSDADSDGWMDLLVTLEWGPVKYFRNEPLGTGRHLVDRTKEAGLAGRLGWWNGFAGADLVRDGDIDYVVSNFGLN